jgi:hypothetical protein
MWLTLKGYYTYCRQIFTTMTLQLKIKFLVQTEIHQIYPEEILRSILDTGEIDAIAVHKDEAVSRGLPYITLPA